MSKPTVHDIAREAGVSLATVDRVLNARPGVREQTVLRVRGAIERLGYVRDLGAANLARRRLYRFAFVLPDGRGQFVSTLRTAIAEAGNALAHERIALRLIDVAAHDPHAIAGSLRRIARERIDGVAIMAAETPQLRDAIARLHAQAVPLVAIVADLPNCERDHFVGINNVAAGRTAAQLMGRFLPGHAGKVMVVTGSMQARDSLERRLGFDAVMNADFPRVAVLPSLEAHDEPQRMAAVVARALARHPDLAGVYSLGSGNQALLETLREASRCRDLVVIAHELTPATRKALDTGEIDAVITQNTGHLVRSAIRLLKARCDGAGIIESQEKIRIEIVMKENLP